MIEISKTLILMGMIFIAVGALFYLFGKIPGMGKLPGDILIKKENFTVYIPITTCIILSVILSLFFYLWNRK